MNDHGPKEVWKLPRQGWNKVMLARIAAQDRRIAAAKEV